MKYTTLLLFLMLSSPSYSAMYKWTDEHGDTHYGERPPNRNQAQNIAPPPPASGSGHSSERLKSLREGILQRTKDGQDAKSDAKKKSSENKKRNEYCSNLRTRIANFKSRPRIRQKNKDGEYAFLDDKQKQKQEKEMQQSLVKDCS